MYICQLWVSKLSSGERDSEYGVYEFIYLNDNTCLQRGGQTTTVDRYVPPWRKSERERETKKKRERKR